MCAKRGRKPREKAPPARRRMGEGIVERRIRVGIIAIGVAAGLSGCAAPLYFAATGAAAGLVGAGVYNASQDGKSQEGLPAETKAPVEVEYRASTRECSNAIVEVLTEAGDSLAAATERLIKTEKRRVNKELQMVSSLLGKAEVYAVKTFTLTPVSRGVKVTVKVDLFRKTIYTDETKKDWPEQEAAIRAQFFEALGKKLRAV